MSEAEGKANDSMRVAHGTLHKKKRKGKHMNLHACMGKEESTMDITSITQAYTDQIAAQNTTASKLNKTLETTDYAKANDDELLDACKQFEAYFMEMIFKEMQKTVDCFKSEESSSSTTGLVDYFKDTAIQDLAATSTDIQGTGLAQMLYEQMKRNYGLE